MISLKNIKKSFNNNEVLKDVSISFNDKGLVSILGPSGCGKSTLLSIIGLLESPSSGDFYYNGINITKISNKKKNKILNNDIGFVYQNYNLIDYMSVEDNIELITKSNNLDNLLKRLNIYHLKKRKVLNLSGGEKQRVAIARALVSNPKILLCDEPTGALDSTNSKIIMDLLKELSKDILVIIVTHNEELAKEYSSGIVKLKDGKVISNTIKYKNRKLNYKYKKVNVNISRIINIVKNNLIKNIRRNILTILATSIGLISLLLVLSISFGFKESLDHEEKNSLSKYPIYISETSTDINNDLSNLFKNEVNDLTKIHSISNNHRNKITKKYVNNLNVINNNFNNIVKSYFIDNKILTVIENNIDDIEVLAGNISINKNEVYILLDKNNNIDSSYLKSIGLKKKDYEYKDILNKTFKVSNKKYEIVGIARHKEESTYSDITGIIYKTNNHKNKIPLSIYIYPKDYNNKLEILKHLNNYKNIKYTDYASTIKSISTNIVDGISYVLIAFSLISLIVSSIMISIISYINILERMLHIGIYKTFGLSNRYIKFIFYLENIIIGMLSTLTCITFTKLISIPINKLLFNLTSMNNIILLNNKNIVIIIIVSLLVSIIGSFIPINKTKKLNVIECLNYK